LKLEKNVTPIPLTKEWIDRYGLQTLL
jgi:hypothetical protein